MSLSTSVQIVQPKFIHIGDIHNCPIPRDFPNIKSLDYPSIKARNETKEEGAEGYDQSSDVQAMLIGDLCYQDLTHICIPFSSSSPIKGAYICLYGQSWSPAPSHLIFTFTSSRGDKTSKKYEFPEFEENHWYCLPVELPDIVLCEITGKGRGEEYFIIQSLFFFRDEMTEETIVREAKEKLWSESPVVNSQFIMRGSRYSFPNPRDDPKIMKPLFSMVKSKDDAFCREYKEYYDRSSAAQKMLKGEYYVDLSHLSIPFPSPSPMKGAYIRVHKNSCSPCLLFTFTDSDGKKVSKKYEIARPDFKRRYAWYFLPIDLDNVVLCEIEGKGGIRKEKNGRSYSIYSLVFTMQEESEIIERLSLLPWK
ncbi:hypothetical protein ADUPG1_006725 [Aduncisulcus paluster]|uniref:Uncharacterized protein n=1 Tax=Aduncisulcus paluster TaxID=2918883 RepID=A0ABQ5KL07_9EUKA|nr:hypothetical protein ADUPG1_006725 [Aduncisulcus paluster]